ncbi:FtsX-like permease family protein [Yinghuangia aomiensis]|uniref:FtsX-like permease family protein n=1 Tax=Yinghuangia aomiensis TaxID=676205 RepID=A0ABP9HFF2_9ACTN
MLKASFRSFLSHKGRMVLSAIAVLLSVAFVSGTLIFTDTITKTFDDLFSSTAADVTVSQKSDQSDEDLAMSGQIKSIPVTTVDKLATVEGVKSAHPSVDVESITLVNADNKVLGRDNGPPTIGISWYHTDRSAVNITSGTPPTGPNQVVIDADTADRKNVKIGDQLRIINAFGRTDVKVVGIATFTKTNPGATLAFLETKFAQQTLLGSTDKISSVELDAAPGVSDDQLKANVTKALGPGFEVKTADEAAKDAADQIGTFINFIKYFMLGFAGVAVLVGIFLIFNTFSMLVAQRTRELGLLRAIGASRGQVTKSVLVESVLLGLIGSTIGLAAGFGLAVGLKALMTAAGMNLKGAELVFKPLTPIVAYLVGTLVTVIAAYIPARRASRISPMAALREAGAPQQKPLKVRTIIGLVLVAAGAFALVGAATGSGGGAGGLLGLGILLTLVSFVVLGPVLARTVIPALSAGFPKWFGPMGRLSRQNSVRNPRRTGATASAVMIGVALVSATSVVASSMNASIADQIDKNFGADFTVQANQSNPLPDEVATSVKATEGVGQVVRARLIGGVNLTYPDGHTTTKDQINAVDPGYTSMWKTDYKDGDKGRVGEPGTIAVSEGVAKDHKAVVGSTVNVTFPGGQSVPLKVVAVQKDDKGGFGFGNASTLSIADVDKADPGTHDFLVMFNGKEGADKEQVSEAVKKTLDPYPQFKVRDQSDYKDQVKGQINFLLYLIYALLGLTIIIAILGVVNTLALSVVERTREIGLMRAIGASRRQIKRMIKLEAIAIAVFAALIGLALGLTWGVVTQRLLANYGLELLSLPWVSLISMVVAAAVIGLLAALMPGRRAAKMNVLRAIASE